MADEAFTVRGIQQMLGLSRHTIGLLIDGGFVTPVRGPRNSWQFSFRDVVLLRAADQLRKARIPTRRIMRSLTALRASLPEDLPLTGLKITAVGDQIVVRRRRQAWHPESGQLLIDLELESAAGRSVSRGAAGRARSPGPGGPDGSSGGIVPAPIDEAAAIEAYVAGEALEGQDREAAEQAYRRALTLDPDLIDAAMNLSALLCEAGRPAEAEAVVDPMLDAHPEVATLHFNRAVAIEDQGRATEAIDGYRAALRRDPTLADAHFNLARLYELSGDAQRALRHLNAYRRLS